MKSFWKHENCKILWGKWPEPEQERNLWQAGAGAGAAQKWTGSATQDKSLALYVDHAQKSRTNGLKGVAYEKVCELISANERFWADF
jgi:hypothetical protein